MNRRNFLQQVGIVSVAGSLGSGTAVYGDSIHDTSERGSPFHGALHPSHPFWPVPRLTLITDHRKHRSRGSGLVILKDKWLFFWREGIIHGTTDGNAVIKMGESRTAGQTIENIRTIYDERPYANGSDLRVRLMGNGRIGLFAVRNSFPERDWIAPVFMYSDDGGETWTSRILDVGSATHPSFTFNRFPSSVGGHDTEGYVLFCYSGGYRPWSSEAGIDAVFTTDNGRTWSHKTVISGLPRGTHEMSVVRLGKTDRWIMVGRSRSETMGSPVFKSTDLFNWEGPYGVHPFLDNPSTIVYHQGAVTWIGASRPHHYRSGGGPRDEILVRGNSFQGLATRTADAEELWRAPNHWPEWEILAYMPVHFDGTFVRHDNHWHMIFGAVEGPMRTGLKYYSQLGIMSSERSPHVPFHGFFPGWMVEPKDAPDGAEGAVEYQNMVTRQTGA